MERVGTVGCQRERRVSGAVRSCVCPKDEREVPEELVAVKVMGVSEGKEGQGSGEGVGGRSYEQPLGEHEVPEEWVAAEAVGVSEGNEGQTSSEGLGGRGCGRPKGEREESEEWKERERWEEWAFQRERRA